MTTYREIHGRSIKAVSTDPTGDITEGEIWYNTTSDTFKSVIVNEAWASASNLIEGKNQTAAFGTQTANLVCGGRTTGAGSVTTQEYNGSGFSTGGDMNVAKYEHRGQGTLTAGIVFGGIEPPPSSYDHSEEYNGTSWTNAPTLATAIYQNAGAGTQTAALSASGQLPPSSPGESNNSQEYDGTSWTNGNNMNTARRQAGGFGLQTAAVICGGLTPPNTAKTEEYDGTSFSEVNEMVFARRNIGNNGIITSGLVYGGAGGSPDSPQNKTESYDGTTWTAASTLGTARYNGGGAGADNTTGHYAGGGPPSGLSISEEFTKSANVITAAAWASIANFPDSRIYSGGSGGTPTSTLVFGGATGPGLPGFVNSGAEFDGSSWTATGGYPISVTGVAGLGPVTAGLGATGYRNTAANVATSAEYDGSSWTAGNNANAAGQAAKMAGVQTAASLGNRSGDEDGHEEYDGTNWTTATNTPVSAGGGAMMAGTQTALLMYGGEATGTRNRTEEWDGSSWTTGANMNLDRRQGSHGGTQTYAIAGGGDSNPGVFANTELWNGTSWSSSANMATARFYQVGGTSVGPSGVASNIAAIGAPSAPTRTNACEEFTEGSSTLNVKTLTQS